MKIFVLHAHYLENFTFEIEFNVGTYIVDISNVGVLDPRYTFVSNEEIVKNLKKEGPSLAYQSYDIAPELLFQSIVQ